MKQLAVLVISIFLTGTLSAQIDTIPPVAKKPQLDTMTPVKRNTLDTMTKRTIDTIPHGTWKNDSAGTQTWKPGTAPMSGEKPADQNNQWNKQADSSKTVMPDRADSNLLNKAAAGKMNQTTDSVVAKAEKPMSDRVMMKEGEMFLVKNGEIMKMDKPFTLPTGLVVGIDGTVSKKGTKPLKLKDGQYIEIKAVPAEKVAEKKPTAKKTTVKSKQ